MEIKYKTIHTNVTENYTVSNILQNEYNDKICNNEKTNFSQADINFQKFLEDANLTQREKDLLLISNHFFLCNFLIQDLLKKKVLSNVDHNTLKLFLTIVKRQDLLDSVFNKYTTKEKQYILKKFKLVDKE